MVSFEKAIKTVLALAPDFGTEQVSLFQSSGRILRAEIMADRDFPPFDRVTMDGIAIRCNSFTKGNRNFKIENTVPAGAAPAALNNDNNCVEVMTGAVLPPRTDTVIRYEDLNIQDGIATVVLNELVKGKNVHSQGFDRQRGEKLVARGVEISPTIIGVAATVGATTLKVSKLPKVAVISTGDELVDVDTKPLPYQIRRSNSHQIVAILQQLKINADTFHLMDNYDEILSKLKSILNDFNIIVLSGGVSKGKFDYLPKALEELGVKKHFHRVAQRPGKPFWMGTKDSTAVFALPGNPVSTFIGTYRYILPFIKKGMQLKNKPQTFVRLAEPFNFAPALTYFLPVKTIKENAGEKWVLSLKGNGSGDFVNLVDADGFVQLAAEENYFEKGSLQPVFWF